MDGNEIAIATLMRENPGFPCVNYCWMTNSAYMSKKAGRNYWDDRKGVFFDFIHETGINLVPQWYFPGDKQRRIEDRRIMHEHLPGGTERIRGPEDIAHAIEQLPSDASIERDFNLERTAREYAAKSMPCSSMEGRLGERTFAVEIVYSGDSGFPGNVLICCSGLPIPSILSIPVRMDKSNDSFLIVGGLEHGIARSRRYVLERLYRASLYL